MSKLPGWLQELGLPPDSWTLQESNPADVAAQVRGLLASHDRLIVAGGDGTVGQALNGLLASQRQDAAMGFFPLGTGNDMARELKLMKTYQLRGAQALLAAFLQDRHVGIDLWDVNGQSLFANYLSVGLDAAVTERFDSFRRDRKLHSVTLSKFRYFQIGLASLGVHLPHCNAGVGNGIHADVSGFRSLILLNISSYASGTLRSPGTRPDDGALSVIGIPTLFHYLCLSPGSVCPALSRFLVRHVLPSRSCGSAHLSWDGEVPLQVDGEPRPDLGAAGHLDVTCKGRVQLLLGERTPWFARL